MRTSIYLFAILLLANPALLGENEQKERIEQEIKTWLEERTEHERYLWLGRKGIFDTKAPNSMVHEMLSQGLEHEDPKIVHCAISAIVFYTGRASDLTTNGHPLPIDRQLGKLPGLYDQLIGLWEEGWEAAGGVLPESKYSSTGRERWVDKTECLAPDPVWTSLALPMATLFPGDDKVYDIIWKVLPQRGPGSLLVGLFEGKFNNPKDQQFRIDLLKNKETQLYWSSIAARSLGDFPAEQGLETLATVLEEKSLKWGTPQFVIVEAMMKYEAEAVPYIPLMRDTLENGIAAGRQNENLQIILKERLVHFEEKYAEEAELPAP